MNLQRLKFAWARGARLQLDYVALGYMGKDFVRSKKDEGWRITGMDYLSNARPGDFFRIHPEDEHLAYGPLSTALLQRPFETFFGKHSKRALLAMAWAVEAYNDGSLVESHIHDWMMFDLFVAELLADEGL